MTLLSRPKPNMTLSQMRASLHKPQPPSTHPLECPEQLIRKPRSKLLEAHWKHTGRMKRVFFSYWHDIEKCGAKCRRPSRPVKPISINSTGTQTLLYNSEEEVDVGSAELALPTLPPAFNQGALSEPEIPVGKLLKHLFSVFVFFFFIPFKSWYGTAKA